MLTANKKRTDASASVLFLFKKPFFVFFCGFFLSVKSPDARQNGDETNGLSQDSADGKAGNVIDQPQGRAEQGKLAYCRSVLSAKADGGHHHSGGGQALEQQIGEGDLLFEDGKGKDIGQRI